MLSHITEIFFLIFLNFMSRTILANILHHSSLQAFESNKISGIASLTLVGSMILGKKNTLNQNFSCFFAKKIRE